MLESSPDQMDFQKPKTDRIRNPGLRGQKVKIKYVIEIVPFIGKYSLNKPPMPYYNF
jgi:hypothetical protein